MCPIFVGTLDGRGMKRPQVNFFISKGHKISEVIFIGFNYSPQESKWIQCKNLYLFDFRLRLGQKLGQFSIHGISGELKPRRIASEIF